MKAAVLPLPVWAWPITSRSARRCSIVPAWMGVGVSHPSSSSARSSGSDSSKSLNCGVKFLQDSQDAPGLPPMGKPGGAVGPVAVP